MKGDDPAFMLFQRFSTAVLAIIFTLVVVFFSYGRYQARPVAVPKREAPEEPSIRVRTPGNYINVLSIDGGGVRLIPALQCLAELEKKAGKPVWEMFDIMVGTSSGALIVAALAAPGEGGKARYSAQELLDGFPKLLERMAAAPLVHPLLSLEGRSAPKFLTRERQRVLIEFFGDKTLTGAALTTIILPAFAIEQNAPFMFASDMGQSTTTGESPGRSVTEAGDYFLADAVIAATGDADVFAPSRVANVTGDVELTFTSASVFAANPTLVAVGEALLRFPQKQCVVISLGGGALTKETPWPARGWDSEAGPSSLVATATTGSTILTAQATALFHRFGSGPVAAYIRLDPTLPASASDPYDFSAGNIAEIQKAGVQLTTEKAATIGRTAEFLSAR